MLTPEEEAEYRSLIARSTPPPSVDPPPEVQETRGFLPRLGQGFLNIPGDVMAMPTQALRTVGGFFGLKPPTSTGGPNELQTQTPEQFSQQAAGYQQIDAPQTWQETAGDIAPVIAREAALLAAPQTKASLLLKGMGAGAKATALGSGLATGAMSGLRNSGQETAYQAGEFAAGNLIADAMPGGTVPKILLKAGLQAATPVAGQALRGENPMGENALIQGGTQGGIELLTGLLTRGKVKPSVVPDVVPTPKGFEPSPGLAAELGISQPVPMASKMDEADTLYADLFGEAPSTPVAPTARTETQRTVTPATLTLQSREAMMAEKGLKPVTIDPESGLYTHGNRSEADVFHDVQFGKPARLEPDLTPTKMEVEGDVFAGTPRLQRPSSQPQQSGTKVTLQTKAERMAEQGLRPASIDSEAGLRQAPEAEGDVFSGVFQQKKIDKNLLKLAKSPIVSQANLAAELKLYGPDELRNLEAIYGTREPKKLAGILIKENRQAERPRVYDVDEPSAGRTDAIDAMEPVETGMRLKSQAEMGTSVNPLLANIAGGGAAGLYGYATGKDEEDRRNRAMLFGAGGLIAPTVLKAGAKGLKGLGPALESAARKASGTEGSLLGKAVLAAEKWGNLGRKDETLLSVEKGKGTHSHLSHQVTESLRKNQAGWVEGKSNPASRAVGEAFLASDGGRAAAQALDASTVPDGFKEALKTLKLSQIEAQNVLRKSVQVGSSKEMLLKSTKGTWQTTAYDIFANPKRWTKDPAAFNKVVDEFQSDMPDTPREVIEANLNQHLAEIRNGDDSFLAPSGRGIKDSTLFAKRMDLTPDQWGFIGQMASDPRMPMGAGTVLQEFFDNKALGPAEQKFIKALSASKGLTDSERAAFREIADKEILTAAYKKLLGEIKDPFEKQMYSLQKLFASVAQAKTIGELATTTLPSGALMAYTDAPRVAGGRVINADETWGSALEAAKTSGNAKLYNELSGYVKLPDTPSLGRLAGAHVPRDVRNALTEITQSQSHVLLEAAKWLNSKSKEVATAWNPGTQIRQAAQVPIFMMAARVNPVKIKQAIEVMFADTGALKKEIREQHITDANFTHSELKQWSKNIDTGRGGNALTRGAKRIREGVLGLYGIPDDLVRVSSYLSQKPRFMEEGAAKGMTGDALERYARDKATIWVNDHTSNYGQVSRGVKFARNVPGVSPFISFTAEMTRLTKNLLKDVAMGDAKDKLWATAALGTMYAAPVALASWAKDKFLSKEEKERFNKAEPLMPVNERGKLKFVYGVNKQGSFQYADMNPWLPAGDLVTMIQTASNGDWGSAFANSPFGVNKNPMLSAALDVYNKEHNFTHQKLDEPKEQIGRVAEAVVPSWAPGGFLFRRGVRSLEPNAEVEGGRGEIDPRSGNEFTPKTLLPAAAGLGLRTANPELLERGAQFQLREKLNDARKDFMRVQRSGASPARKKQAEEEFLRKRNALLGP